MRRRNAKIRAFNTNFRTVGNVSQSETQAFPLCETECTGKAGTFD